MERPPSLNTYMEESGLPEPEALPEWEKMLWAYIQFVKEGNGEDSTL